MSDSLAHSRSNLIPRFDARRCKQCGLCMHLCPADALGPAERSTPILIHTEACTGCRTCELICPDFAILMADPRASSPAEVGG